MGQGQVGQLPHIRWRLGSRRVQPSHEALKVLFGRCHVAPRRMVPACTADCRPPLPEGTVEVARKAMLLANRIQRLRPTRPISASCCSFRLQSTESWLANEHGSACWSAWRSKDACGQRTPWPALRGLGAHFPRGLWEARRLHRSDRHRPRRLLKATRAADGLVPTASPAADPWQETAAH